MRSKYWVMKHGNLYVQLTVGRRVVCVERQREATRYGSRAIAESDRRTLQAGPCRVVRIARTI